MKVGRQARKDAKTLFVACINKKGVLDERKVKKTVKLVLENKPRGYLAILNQFQKLIRLKLDETAATITTAEELTEEQLEEIMNVISKAYGNDLTFYSQIDPEVIGGARIQIGSNVFDATVKARLDKLNEVFQ